MFVIVGTEWCPGCKFVREKLTKLNMDFRFVKAPHGPKGWELAEQLSGQRKFPVIFHMFKNPKELKEALDQLGLPERELTEDEYDEIYD